MKQIGWLLVGIVSLTLVGGVAAAGSGGPMVRVTHTTARYNVVPVEQGNVDVDPTGTSLGDQTISRNSLRQGGKQVGSLVSACTFTTLSR